MNPLEIVVTGNVDQATSALQGLQGDLGKTVLSGQKAGEAFDQMAAKMAQFQRAAQNTLNPELVTIYNGKIQELQASMRVLAEQADAEALRTEEVTSNMAKMTAVAGGATVGQQRLAAAIARSTDPYQIAAREINNFSRRLLYFAGAGVMQLAIGAIQEILPYVEQFFSDLNQTSDAAKLAAANISNWSDINKAANESIAKETASLTTLYSIATDVNRSMYDRIGAVQQLKKEFPDYFASITQENILNGHAKEAYDALTNSLIANAIAKAQLDKISKIGVDRGDVQSQIDDLNAARKALIQSVHGPKDLAVAAGAQVNPVVQTAAQQITDINLEFDQKIKPLQAKINGFNGQIDHIKQQLNPSALLSGDGKEHGDYKSGVLAAFDAQIKTLKDYKENVALTASEIASVNAQIKKLEDERAKFDPTAKKGKKTNPFEISLKELEDQYKQAQALLVQQYDANLTDTKKNTTAVNDIIYQLQIDFLEKKLTLIKKYGQKEGDTELAIAKANQARINNQLAFTQGQNNSLQKIPGAPTLNLKAATEKIDTKPYYDLSDAITKNIKLQQEHLELMQETAQVVDKTVGPAFQQLFEDILNGSTNAFRAFGKALEQLMVQIAAAVLKAALFAAILSIINPGATAASGTGGFENIFKGLLGLQGGNSTGLGGGIQARATGGMIDGPGTTTSDSILARLSRGEYVMNASAVSKFGSSFFDSLNTGRLPGFSSGGPVGSNMVISSDSNVFIPEVKVKGSDLLIVFNRANQRASRNG